jgi:hypothetical protein
VRDHSNNDWHIRIEQRYLNNAAGSGARKKERELAEAKHPARRYIERLVDARSEERNWRRGAEGEEQVAAELARLDERWAVIHDLTIGRKGANLDHLVIGPPGIFALNTKNLTGRLTVYEHAILQNGQRTAFVPAALREARSVQDRLSAAVRREVRAWSVLVVLGCRVQIRRPPANLTVVEGWRLRWWLDGLSARNLDPAQVFELERAARTPGTWLAPRAASRRPPTPRPTAVPPTVAEAPSGIDRSSTGVRVRRWTRYGKDRLYANGTDGLRLGYLEVATGEIVLEVADPNGTIAAQLRASHRALGIAPDAS